MLLENLETLASHYYCTMVLWHVILTMKRAQIYIEFWENAYLCDMLKICSSIPLLFV